MEPFRELVKPNNTFHWDSTLDKLFAKSKELLIQIYMRKESRHMAVNVALVCKLTGAKRELAIYFCNKIAAAI